MQFNLFSLSGLAVLSLTPLVSSYAIASPSGVTANSSNTPPPPAAGVTANSSSTPTPSERELKVQHDFENVFAMIASVPEDIAATGDDEAARAWMLETYPDLVTPTPAPAEAPPATAANEDNNNRLEARQVDVGAAAECATELALNLPILRIGRFIRLLGDVPRLADRLRRAARDPAQRTGAIIDLIDIITGIPSVKKECWDDFRA